MFEGNKGRILRVEDSGDGFDVEAKIHQFLAGEKYWHNQGYGLRNLAANPLVFVGWEDHGRVAHMHVPFPDGIDHRRAGVQYRPVRKRSVA